MYALAICGSPHKHGNTNILLETTLEPLKDKGWETEIYSLAGKNLHGCLGCGWCLKNQKKRCVINKDALNDEILPCMFKADVIIIGAPTYFAGINADAKAVIDRGGFVCQTNGALLAGKIGAAVVAARRAGTRL